MVLWWNCNTCGKPTDEFESFDKMCPKCNKEDGKMMSVDTEKFTIKTNWELLENRFFEELDQNPVPILIKKVHEDGNLSKKRNSDIAWDVTCVSDDKWHSDEEGTYFDLEPGDQYTFSTGIQVATPDRYGFLIRDRSGIGVSGVVHTAGVIEGTYRGEWKIHLINHGTSTYTFRSGDRIAQAVLTPIIPAAVQQVDDLPSTDRGDKGFGSSGR